MSAPSRAGRRLLLGGGVLFAVLFALGTVPRLRHRDELQALARESEAAPVVRTVAVRAAPPATELTLPGTVEPIREAALYPRANGYVRRFHADIGARVRAGQLLAEIETPEVDQELAQARASLGQARASYGLARTTLDRWQAMVKDSAATRQELDERSAAFNAAGANVAAAEASARRLQELQSFGRVAAPFSGTVTQRSVEVGQLVSPSQGARPLFVLAQSDTVRVMVNVPEEAAAQVRAGGEAHVVVRGSTEARPARVVRTAGALDAATRTMLAEVDVPNAAGTLLPGMYAQVKLAVHDVAPGLLLPANALITGAAGPQVALVRDGRVHFAKLQLGRDLGTDIEVLSGVAAGDIVVLNPSDEVAEGVAVRAMAQKGKNE